MSKATSRPLISVVTVSLDAAKYVRQCIESVVQSDCQDFEYVVIDGGSKDGTAEIIREYEGSLAYWHSRPDRGLAHAFNEALVHTRGQWILYLNSDDYLVDTAVLSKMAVELRARPRVDVVFGQIIVVSRAVEPVRISGPHGATFSWKEFLRRDSIPHQAAFTNREFFDRVGNFDERYRIAVDYEHYLRGGRTMTCEFVPILVANQRDGGLSRASVRKSLREWAVAQIESGGRLPVAAWSNYLYLVCRATVGSAVRWVGARVTGGER